MIALGIWIIAGAVVWTALRITMWLNDNPILDLRERYVELADSVERLQIENALLRTALEWYADEANYAHYEGGAQYSEVMTDFGKRAKAALTNEQGK